MARTAPAVLAAWAVLSAACAGGGEPAGGGDAAPAPPPFRSGLIGEPGPRVEPFRLTLQSPGAEPRRLLRYRVTPGSRERTRIWFESGLDIFVAGRRVNKVAAPATEVAFDIDVAARPGGYRCTAWITDTASADWERMAPGRGSELRTALEQLRGHHVTFEVDERGHPLGRAITLPESLESNRAEALQTLQFVDGSVVPFPPEPVGVGAVWAVADAQPGRSNLAGPVTLTYTLTAMRGDQVDVSMSLGLPQEPAPLSLTGKEVAGYRGAATSGAIRMKVDLRRLMPDTEGQIISDFEGRTFVGGEELPFTVHGEVRQRLDSR